MSHPFKTASSPENHTGPRLGHRSEEMPEEIGNQNRVMGGPQRARGDPHNKQMSRRMESTSIARLVG